MPMRGSRTWKTKMLGISRIPIGIYKPERKLETYNKRNNSRPREWSRKTQDLRSRERMTDRILNRCFSYLACRVPTLPWYPQALIFADAFEFTVNLPSSRGEGIRCWDNRKNSTSLHQNFCLLLCALNMYPFNVMHGIFNLDVSNKVETKSLIWSPYITKLKEI